MKAGKSTPTELADKDESVQANETVFPVTASTLGLILETNCSPLPVPVSETGIGLNPTAFSLFAANLILFESTLIV